MIKKNLVLYLLAILILPGYLCANIVGNKASIQVLEPQSYPAINGSWQINFITSGRDTLKINNLSLGQVEFVGLYYYDIKLQEYKIVPVDTKTGVIKTDWNYEIGRIICKPLSIGKHQVKLSFGNETYASNNALVTEIVSTESTHGSYFPSVAVDDSYIYICWWDYTNVDDAGWKQNIFFKKRPITGSWSSNTEVVSTGSTEHSNYPRMVVDDAYVYIAWFDNTDLEGTGTVDKDVFFKRKLKNGIWPVTAELVSTESTSIDSYTNYQLAMDVDDTNVYIAWEDITDYQSAGTNKHIFFKKKEIAGTWPEATEVVTAGITDISSNPSISVYNGKVHLSWEVYNSINGSSDIIYKAKDIPGAWPSEYDNVTSENPGDYFSHKPSLKVNSSGVHVAWECSRAGANQEIYYKKKPNNTTWPTNAEVVSTESAAGCNNASLAVDNNYVYVVWDEVTTVVERKIMHKRKELDAAWPAQTDLVSIERLNDSGNPSLIVYGGNSYVAWQDNSALNNETTTEIYFRKFSNTLPVCQVTYPNGNEIVTGIITLLATAQDSDGGIQRVDFYYTTDNGKTNTFIGTSAGPTYTCNWNTAIVREGIRYQIKVVAVAVDGDISADLSDDYFELNSDSLYHIYSYLTDTTAKAYKGTSLVQPLADETNPSTEITDFSSLYSSDDIWETQQATDNKYNVMKFVFKITENVVDINKLRIIYEGHGATGGGGYDLYAWNNNEGYYVKISSNTEYPYSEDHVVTPEITANINNYVKGDGTVQILAESVAAEIPYSINTIMYTDYVRLEVMTDTVAPAAISDLNCTPGIDQGQIILFWTAQGDDGNTGIATEYLIKYSTVSFTDTDWESQWVVDIDANTSILPSPAVAGSAETMIVNGLSPGVKYWFAIKTEDEVPNTSLIDTTSPQANAIATTSAAPQNFKGAASSSNSITWQWDSCSASDFLGYEIRYATFTHSDYNQYAYVWSKNNDSSLSQMSANQTVVTGLQEGITYYARLIAYYATNTIVTEETSYATNNIPAVTMINMTWTQAGNIPIPFYLTDKDYDFCSINVEYSIDNGLNFKLATTGPDGEKTTDLLATTIGKKHFFPWDSTKDIGFIMRNVQIKITPYDQKDYGNGVTGNSFVVENTQGDNLLNNLSSYPNPFNPRTTAAKIAYSLSRDANVEINIYDLLGERVIMFELTSGSSGGAAGYNEVLWDGKNGEGINCANGTYYVIAKADDGQERVTLKWKVALVK